MTETTSSVAAHLENVLLVLDVFHLLQSDDVVDGEDLESEVVPAGPLSTQTNSGKCSCADNTSKQMATGFSVFQY